MLNEWKIRRLLNDDRYSLQCEYDEEGKNVVNWKLYKKYKKTNLSNCPIMSSDTFTEKELHKFAKKHRKYGINTLYDRVFYILLIIVWLFILINLKLDSTYLSGIIMGIDISVFILMFTNWSIQNRKYKLQIKEHEEDIKELLDNLINDLKKSINSSDNNG